jgi:hypothetical protein
MGRAKARMALETCVQTIGAVKDETKAYPLATEWRPVVQGVVRALACGDYALATGVPAVMPPSQESAEQIRSFVANYGEDLSELPDEAWETSVSQWMGTHWDVLVDLWTKQSGRSDMVLSLRITEAPPGFLVEIDSVYVP